MQPDGPMPDEPTGGEGAEEQPAPDDGGPSSRGLAAPDVEATGTFGGAPAGGESGPGTLDFLDPPRAADEIGRLAHYRILRPLGEGNMGLVFKAEDTHLGRPVALKVIRPERAGSPIALQRFFREARATAAIKNDHIVTIYQVAQERDVPFIVMEYLRGSTLARWLERGRRPTVEQVLRIGREAAIGLAAAHDRGLIHRDIKPANLWLEAPGGRVKILDFGLARAENEELEVTQDGAIVGSPAYMAPEQARGRSVGPSCDLFSLGCILYRLATGRPPFRGTTVVSLLASLLTDTPVPPREIEPALPPALDALIVRLLAKEPAGRPASARAVVEAIAAIERDLATGTATATTAPASPPGGDPPPAADRPAPPRPGRRARRAAALLLAIGAASAALLLARPTRGRLGVVAEGPTRARLVVEREGRPVATLEPGGRSEVALEAGTYRLRLDGDPSARLERDSVRLDRGRKAVVTIRRAPAVVGEGPAVAPARGRERTVAHREERTGPDEARPPRRGRPAESSPPPPPPAPDVPPAPVPDRTASPSVLASRGGPPDTVKGWGTIIDPQDDCKVVAVDGGKTLHITVPGKPAHLLSAEIGIVNAPRVLRPVVGDFDARVRVAGTGKPAGKPTANYHAYHGAGLLIWQDEGNYLRLEIATDIRENRPVHYANFELRRDGKLLDTRGVKIDRRISYVRLERRGEAIRASLSRDGEHWELIDPMEARFDDRVEVGVAAVNSATKQLTAELGDYSVTVGGPDGAEATPGAEPAGPIPPP